MNETKNFNFNKNPDHNSFQTVKSAPINLAKIRQPKKHNFTSWEGGKDVLNPLNFTFLLFGKK